MYCPPSKSKRSEAMICHGQSGVGCFSRGRSHCLNWKCWQLLIICSMSFVILHQWIIFFAQRFVLVMSWCPTGSCCRTCAHSDSGISSASPYRISLSFTVSVEACQKYFLMFFGTSEASSCHPSIIICDSAHSSGICCNHILKCSFLLSCQMGVVNTYIQGYLRSWLRMISG